MMNSGSPFNEKQGSLAASLGESKAMERGDGGSDSNSSGADSGSESGSDDRKPSPKDPNQMMTGSTGRRGGEIAGRPRERSSPSRGSPKAAGPAPARSSQRLPSSSYEARSDCDGTPRKRPRYTLDQLEDIAAQVRDTDSLDVDEKQRQMGIVYSKRKRLRAKLREKSIEEERDLLFCDNDRLRRENEHLEEALRRSLRVVSEIEAGALGPSCVERTAPHDEFLRANQQLKKATSILSRQRSAPNRLIQDPTPDERPPLTDPADMMLHASLALDRPASVPSFHPQTSLLEWQLLRREPVQQQPTYNLPDMFDSSRPSPYPDLALLSRSSGILRQRLAGHSDERCRHLNAVISASLPSPASGPSTLGMGLESLLSGRGLRAGPWDDSALGQLHRQSLLSSRAVSASAALAAASATSSSSALLQHWGGHSHHSQWQPDPTAGGVPPFSASGSAPPSAARALLGMLPAHEQLVLSRMDAMSATDLLALYRHFRETSPVAAQIVGRTLRRRLEAANAASVAAAARHAHP